MEIDTSAKIYAPQYNMVGISTIQGERVALYLREKQSLLEHISEIPGRVNLTLDLVPSDLGIGYAFVAGHFINSDWNLERRILNVIKFPFPDPDDAFNQAIISCTSDWHLENKLLTITLDKSYSNKTIMGNLRGLLPVKNSLLLNGQLLKGSCYARLLSQLAQDAMSRVHEPIKRIRESVKYVKTSQTREQSFVELRQQLQVHSTMELVVDDLTKWNTTYHMLAAACELKEVFGCWDTADPVYKINLSVDDWKQVEVLCIFLKLLFEAASILTAPVYPPANAFYHEVTKIQLELSAAVMSQDPFVSTLTRPLKQKFDEYWRESFLVLAIAVVMDPRFKMKLVEFSFSKIFGKDADSLIKSVNDCIHELFLDYIAPPPANLSQSDPNMAQDIQHQVFPQGTQKPQVNPQDLLVLSGGDEFSDFEAYLSATATNQHLKSELDQYLEEYLLPRVLDFDVLGWWKLGKVKYRTLSRLAADILSIPFSTVGPEAVFDTSIICGKDWLQNGSFSPSSQLEGPIAAMKLE